MTTIDEYIEEHVEPEDEYLYRLWRATNIHTIHGRMASGHVQGCLLTMLVRMMKPRNVLEVGTFSGYSALCLARGLDDGHVYTYEINDEMEPFTRPWIEQSAWADKITFSIGDAMIEAPRLGIMFDMMFIDGNKRTYVETYEALLPVLKSGGFMLADNTLWDGHVVDPAYNHEQQTKGIKRFNNHVMQDERVEQVIVPIRDGLTIIRKK